MGREVGNRFGGKFIEKGFSEGSFKCIWGGVGRGGKGVSSCIHFYLNGVVLEDKIEGIKV